MRIGSEISSTEVSGQKLEKTDTDIHNPEDLSESPKGFVEHLKTIADDELQKIDQREIILNDTVAKAAGEDADNSLYGELNQVEQQVQDVRNARDILDSALESGSQPAEVHEVLVSEFTRAKKRVEAVVEQVSQISSDQAAANPKLIEVTKKILEKTVRYVSRMLQLSAFAAIGLETHHVATSDTLSKDVMDDGKIVYHHPDSETEHIINVISGIEAMSEEEQLMITRRFLADNMKSSGKNIPTNLESMSRSALEELITITFFSNESDSTKIREGVSGFFRGDTGDPEVYDQEMYKVLWQTEEEVGAPKVRWLTPNPRSDHYNRSLETTPHYNAITDTLYVPVGQAVETFMAEVAHSKQFTQAPLESILQQIPMVMRVAGRVITEGKSINGAYLDEYTTPGSLEYEAHKQIQPVLEERFPEPESIEDWSARMAKDNKQ